MVDKKFILVGYSGHGFVVADILQKIGRDILGYCEIEEKIFNPFQLEYLGFEEDIAENVFVNNEIVVALGNNAIRQKVSEMLMEKGCSFISVIHPDTNIGFGVEIEKGSVIMAGVVVNTIAKIGKGVILNTSSVIEHECKIGNYAHIAPGAVLAGNVKIGERTFVGANAVIKQGVIVGKDVIIGAGSVVIKDIADNETWVGNPARKIK